MSPVRTLVVSYCFPPYSDTAGVVAAKRVLERNEPVDVISNAMDTIRHKDYSLTYIGGDLVRRFKALTTETAFSSWKAIEAWVEAGAQTAQRWQMAQGPYERMYSRAQFTASHFLGAQIKLQQPEITWLAEFSDPLSHDVLGRPRQARMAMTKLAHTISDGITEAGFLPPPGSNLLEWCEIATFALADEFMFTNQTQMDFMLGHCGDERLARRVRERATVSPHPTLPREFYTLVPTSYQLPRNKVNIGYFGNFYANRGVGLILDALAGAPARITNKVLLHAFTSKPDELKALADEKQVRHLLRIGPYRDYLEFLNLADAMDVLLINDAVTPPGGVNPFLPSKWSDYKGTTTPVWGILEEGSTLDGVEGIRYRTPVEHVTAIQATLAAIVADVAR